MSEGGDRLRSLLRGAAREVQRRAEAFPPLAQARRLLGELRHGRLLVPADALRAQLLRVPELDSLWLEVRPEGVLLDASFTRGEPLRVTLVPVTARFAPRGAKELVFRVEPPERAGSARTADLCAALAVAVARALWAPLLPPDDGAPPDAIIDRDPGAELRIDLRSLPPIRRLRGAQQALLDGIPLVGFGATQGALVLQLPVPGAARGGRRPRRSAYSAAGAAGAPAGGGTDSDANPSSSRTRL